MTAYLLVPVQRLPRYLMLVKKMIHYTKKMKADRAKSQRESQMKSGFRALSATTYSNQSRRSSSYSSRSTGAQPYQPSLESLKRAEAALHAMLLELDQRIGSDLSGQTFDPNFMVGRSSICNSCSDSVDSRSASHAAINCLGQRRTSKKMQ